MENGNIRKTMKNNVLGHKKFVMAAQVLKFSKMEKWDNLRKGLPEVFFTKTHRQRKINFLWIFGPSTSEPANLQQTEWRTKIYEKPWKNKVFGHKNSLWHLRCWNFTAGTTVHCAERFAFSNFRSSQPITQNFIFLIFLGSSASEPANPQQS